MNGYKINVVAQRIIFSFLLPMWIPKRRISITYLKLIYQSQKMYLTLDMEFQTGEPWIFGTIQNMIIQIFR